jgi:hypothetical protein
MRPATETLESLPFVSAEGCRCGDGCCPRDFKPDRHASPGGDFYMFQKRDPAPGSVLEWPTRHTGFDHVPAEYPFRPDDDPEVVAACLRANLAEVGVTVRRLGVVRNSRGWFNVVAFEW